MQYIDIPMFKSQLSKATEMAINETGVEVTFAALANDVKAATIVVKDSKGAVVETVETDIAKGATSTQFDFVKSVTTDALTGVWTVNNLQFSFTELKAVADIVAEANEITANEVKLLDLLNTAGIKELDKTLIGAYATEIKSASPAPEKYADIQTAVDKVNKETTDNAKQLKPVLEAKTQLALLEALQANYERVNKDWIVAYSSGAASAAGIDISAAVGTDNTIYIDASSNTGTTAKDVQTAIDAVNDAQIDAANTAAATREEQAKVTALIQNWMKADEADATATPKADAIKDSQIKEAAFKVAEATTENSLYNALVAYANITPDTVLKVGELNTNLKAEYKTALDTITAATLSATIEAGDHADATNGIKAKVVTEADDAALGDETTGALGAINALTEAASKAEDVKTALQKLADVTAHKTGLAKFDMSTVKEDQLLEYVKLATNGFEDATVNAISVVNDAISEVNAGVDEKAYLKTITDADATATQVGEALLALALSATTNDTVEAYINADEAVQVEVAQFIIDNRSNLADPLTAVSLTDYNATPTYVAYAIGKAMEDQAAEIAKFNNIGDLNQDTVTKSTIKTALDTYAYGNYVTLSDVQKVKVAAEIKKLTKPTSATDATPVALDFSGDDAVKTLAEANAIIDAAIAKAVQ